jgi:hypothetical protein
MPNMAMKKATTEKLKDLLGFCKISSSFSKSKDVIGVTVH